LRPSSVAALFQNFSNAHTNSRRGYLVRPRPKIGRFDPVRSTFYEGYDRGPCPTFSLELDGIESQSPDATLTFGKIKFGELDSICSTGRSRWDWSCIVYIEIERYIWRSVRRGNCEQARRGDPLRIDNIKKESRFGLI
jgi:hypothetical protein